MDVLLFTAEEPVYLPRSLEPVVDAHGEAISAVVIARPPAGRLAELRRQYRLYGPVAFARMAIRFGRGVGLDRLPADLGRRLTGRYHSVATLAAAHGIPVRRVDDVSAPTVVDAVAAMAPDVALSVVCPQKLPRSILEVPALAINLHGSLLPKYRGRATAFWPLYHGDERTGVTAHVMTESFDAGPIIEQRAVRIEDGDAMHDLSVKLATAGADLGVDLLQRLRAVGPPFDVETRPNPTTPSDYRSMPTPAERREFRRRGNRFV